MCTCLSAAPGSAVESTAHGEGCQSVLGEWPCLNNCEEWITLDKLDFICALVAQNLLQTEPNLVKLFFGCWLVTAPGIQLAGLWNQGSGQWICWSGKETTAKGSGNFARATGNAEIWGTEQASFELFGTAGLHVALHQRQRKQQLCGFLLGGLFWHLVAASYIYWTM